mgnify:CR=1 FL=1
MKNRVIPDLGLGAFDQHFLRVDIIPLTPRICLGAALKQKSSAKRFYIPSLLLSRCATRI